MNWIKRWVFLFLGIGFAGKRRVLRAMAEFVKTDMTIFEPRGRFAFKERLAMAFFGALIRSPAAVLSLFPALLLALLTYAMRALGFWV
jgi:hypothetical protein